MKVFYYAIYDDKAEEFGPLFPAKNDNVAIRHFKQLVGKSPNADDFTLKCLCEIDQESGQIGLPFEQYEVPISMEVDE